MLKWASRGTGDRNATLGLGQFADRQEYRNMDVTTVGSGNGETSGETGVITLHYWAAAKSAAGVAGDELPVDGPISLAEVVRRAVALHPGTRLPGRAADLLGAARGPAGDRRGPRRRGGRAGHHGGVPAALRRRLIQTARSSPRLRDSRQPARRSPRSSSTLGVSVASTAGEALRPGQGG